MSTNRLDSSGSGVSTPEKSEFVELDMRPLFRAQMSWWREAILIGIIAAFLGAAILLLLRTLSPLTYEASTDIIRARVVSSVNLVETYRTTTDDATIGGVDDGARREALVNLVMSGAIADKVIAELGDLLTIEERDPATLIDMVSAEAPLGSDDRTISDLIRITVRANDPEKAAAIANAWSRHYVAHINSVYNQVPLEIVELVGQDLQEASAEYLAAQQAFEAFVANNQISDLQNQIDQKAALRTNYQEAQKALTASVVDRDRAARARLFGDLVTAQTDALYQVFNQQVQEKTQQLAQYYQSHDLAQRQLAQAQNLRRQIEEGATSPGAGTLLALHLLETQVYANVAGITLPTGLNIDLGETLTDSDTESATDVAALIAVLEQYSDQLSEEINVLSTQLLNGADYDFVDSYTPESLIVSASGQTISDTVQAGGQNELDTAIYARFSDLFKIGDLALRSETEQNNGDPATIGLVIDKLARELNSLQAALVGEQSRQQLLTQQRDQAWSTYDTLSSKVVELRLARTAANTEVRLGNLAVAPNEPIPGVSLISVTLGAGALGVIFALMLVTVAHLMNWRLWSFRRNNLV